MESWPKSIKNRFKNDFIINPLKELEDKPVSKLDVRSKRYNKVEAEAKMVGPHGLIQWKGTEVCIDLYCKCGAHLHHDGEFFYNFECGKCGKVWAVSPYVKLIEMDTEELIEDTKKNSCFVVVED